MGAPGKVQTITGFLNLLLIFGAIRVKIALGQKPARVLLYGTMRQLYHN